jgi:parallel beta helix pectate lyase-like protein
MITKRNIITYIRAGRKPPASPASGARAGRGSRRLFVAVVGVTALAAGGAFAVAGAFNGNASVLTNCATTLASCKYPAATTTGIPAGTALKSVPGQVSSGPGWSYSAAGNDVAVTGNGAVLSGLYIPYYVHIQATNVTVNNVQIVTGGNWGISLTHTTGVTIENSTISGQNSTTGRVGAAIDDVYSDSTGIVIKNNNISAFKTAIQISAGLVEGNYIHDPGYIAGDHTNGIYIGGGTGPVTIEDNTILNNLSQTDAINLDAGTAGVPTANMTIENNFLAGGVYSIYAGDARSNPTSNIVITGNRFGQLYYPLGGQYGAAAYFDHTGTGNVWSDNSWDTTGQAVAAPTS